MDDPALNEVTKLDDEDAKEATLYTPDHEDARNKLLNGELDPKGFLTALMRLDQADIEHHAAEGNMRLLDEPEIVARIDSGGHESHVMRLQYHGLFTFHVGQSAAMQGELSAPRLFDRAHASKREMLAYIAEHRHESPPENQADIDRFLQDEAPLLAYTEATAAYMRGRSEVVRRCYEELAKLPTDHPLSANTAIVRSLLAGLEQRGAPNYAADYHP